MKMVVLGSLCGLEKEMHVGKGTVDNLFFHWNPTPSHKNGDGI